MLRTGIWTLAAALCATSLAAQSPTSSDQELFRTIGALDRELFATANETACDLEKFQSYFAEDVEFYHDQSGLTAGRATVTQQVKDNLCGKVRRELVDGTLEVFPLPGYGAVQTGVHRFLRPKEGSAPTGQAKFLHVWRYADDGWKITRVVSYDHRAAPF